MLRQRHIFIYLGNVPLPRFLVYLLSFTPCDVPWSLDEWHNPKNSGKSALPTLPNPFFLGCPDPDFLGETMVQLCRFHKRLMHRGHKEKMYLLQRSVIPVPWDSTVETGLRGWGFDGIYTMKNQQNHRGLSYRIHCWDRIHGWDTLSWTNIAIENGHL